MNTIFFKEFPQLLRKQQFTMNTYWLGKEINENHTGAVIGSCKSLAEPSDPWYESSSVVVLSFNGTL